MDKKKSKGINSHRKTEKGQLSIFLGICLLLLITLLAFTVNVGLFVKAKINLQNAVDAAAWSGAATQARQLTNIAYLNWEMRNNYKEWMFKYYVIGQLSLNKIAPRNLDNNGQYVQPHSKNMSYRLTPFFKETDVGDYDPQAYDRYNMPSVCIHFHQTHNLCDTATLPGLPRFDPVGIPGISEQAEAFTNRVVSKLGAACTARTVINFGSASTWVYGTGGTISTAAPEILSHRLGAWTNALLLAFRMRNLEMIVNRPPVDLPICYPPGGPVNNCTSVMELDQESASLPALNERPVKAFWSAYRNLSVELKQTFKLTEIAPSPFSADPNTLSSFLIPDATTIGQSGVPATVKHYLDLQAYPLNLVTFFTNFSSYTAQAQGRSSVRQIEAECAGSKTALPVPSFIFGFVKNPEVLTYYAVKGEARFTGLFFPFTNYEGIKLSAYAAAKPYGGRIGPRLFSIHNNREVRARNTAQARSLAYVSGMRAINDNYRPGYPVPTDNDFWVSRPEHVIGGIPTARSNVRFGVPNLIYEFQDASISLRKHSASAQKIQIIQAAPTERESRVPTESVGLYSKEQFRPFTQNLISRNRRRLTPEQLDRAIDMVRRPTKYEALNYLIPTPEIERETDWIPHISKKEVADKQYKIFAPLWGNDTLYPSARIIVKLVRDTIRSNEKAINVLMDSLEMIHDNMLIQKAIGGSDAYLKAAKGLWNLSVGKNNKEMCKSLSGKFYQLFLGEEKNFCPGLVPLPLSMSEFITMDDPTGRKKGPHANNKYYFPNYTKPDFENSMLLSAYMPGPRQGALPSGETVHPFIQDRATLLSRRNFYSTKLISLKKVTPDADSSYIEKGVYMENARLGDEPEDLTGITFKNAVDLGQISEFRDSKYENFDH